MHTSTPSSTPLPTENPMPPVDTSWLTEQILEITKGIARVETQVEGLQGDMKEVKEKLTDLPCPTQGSRLTRVEEQLAREDRARGWRGKAWLVLLGAILSACGGLTVVGAQRLLASPVAQAAEVQQVAQPAPAPEDPIGLQGIEAQVDEIQIRVSDAYEALTTYAGM